MWKWDQNGKLSAYDNGETKKNIKKIQSEELRLTGRKAMIGCSISILISRNFYISLGWLDD